MKVFKLLILLLVSGANYLYAQTSFKFSEQQTGANGNIVFAKLDNPALAKADNNTELQLLQQVCKPDTHISFALTRSYGDNMNYTHKVYQAYYDKIEIMGMGFVLHVKDNSIQFFNGSFANISPINTTPSIDENTAAVKAVDYFNVEAKKISHVTTKNYGLVISKNILGRGTEYALSYKIRVQNSNPVASMFLYVEAKTGRVINAEYLICEYNTHKLPPNAGATGETLYSGTVAITTDSYLGQFRLRELTNNNVSINTLNAHHLGPMDNLSASATDFFDNNTSWTATEHPTDRAALDAHWGAENVFAYWQNVHNRNSIDNAGMPIISYVHVLSGMNNAYWDDITNSMLYGDGDGISFRPFTAIDVCAHEFGHGICQYTSNLAHVADESGALNEGFSDIWGACVEAYAGKPNYWILGEDIILIPPYFVRSMSNPQAGYFVTPDTYHGANWYTGTNGDTYSHINLGVLNHWFYLLSDGGSGWNNGQTSHASAGNGYQWSVAGIGIDHAAKIAYRTETLLHSSDNYQMARTLSIQAAKDIYGVGSCEEIAVTNAWYAVGVGANYPNLVITGPSNVCSSSVYCVNNAPNGASITWNISNPNVATITPSANGLCATVTLLSNAGAGVTITAALSTCNSFATTKSVFIGSPFLGGTYTNTFDNSVHPLGYYPYVDNPACTYYWSRTNMDIMGATWVTWSLVSAPNGVNWNQVYNVNDINFYLYAPNNYAIFRIDVSNACGSVSRQFKWLASTCSTGGGGGSCKFFTVSPNPSSGRVIVTIPDKPAPCNFSNPGESSLITKDMQIAKINVYNLSGTAIMQAETRMAKEASIDLSRYPNGSYFVEIIAASGYKEKQLVILNK